jgi:hypothetical protein
MSQLVYVIISTICVIIILKTYLDILFQKNPSLLVPWMLYTCFYILATVVSYVINTVAYVETKDMLLAGVSVVGAILMVCKYVVL